MSSTLDRSRNYYLIAAENDQIRKELIGKYNALEGKAVMRRLTRSQLKSRRMLIGVLRRTGNEQVVMEQKDMRGGMRRNSEELRRERISQFRSGLMEERKSDRSVERLAVADEDHTSEESAIRIEKAEDASVKKRILLSSKLVSGREIVDALGAAGVELDDFCDALECVDCYELALDVRQARNEGRRGKDEFPPVLSHFHLLIDRLNKCPASVFPYNIAFVFRAEDARAKPCLTQLQLWYELGRSDVTQEKKYCPPSKDVGDVRFCAYQDGYIGRNCAKYFSELAGLKQGVEERRKVITLKRNATLKDLWNAFPGGQSALLKRLEQQQCVSFVRREFVCDPESKRVLIENAFPTDQFGDAWLRETLGVEFEEE